MTPPERVWILDTSALVEAKSALSIHDQWQTFKLLEGMVVAGTIAMPRQVIREISEITHPDLPGAWATAVRGVHRHPLDPQWVHVQRVMAEAGDVVDPNKLKEDRVDRNRIAVTTACQRLGIQHCSVRDFLGRLGVKTKKPASEADGAE